MIPVRYNAAQRSKFYSLFGHSITAYWSILTGFNIIKFDEEVVKPADGESTKDKLRSAWGESAVALIKELLNYPAAA